MSRRSVCVILGIVIACGMAHDALYAQCTGLAQKLNAGTVPDLRSHEGCKDGPVTTEITAAAAHLVKEAYNRSDSATLKKIAQLMREMFALYLPSKLDSQKLINSLQAELNQQGIAALKLTDPPPDKTTGIGRLASAIESLPPRVDKKEPAGKEPAKKAPAGSNGNGTEGAAKPRPKTPVVPPWLEIIQLFLAIFGLLLLVALPFACTAWVYSRLRHERQTRNRSDEENAKHLGEVDRNLAANQTGPLRNEVAEIRGLLVGLQGKVDRLAGRRAGEGNGPQTEPAESVAVAALREELQRLRGQIGTPDKVRSWMQEEVRSQLQNQRGSVTQIEKGLSLADLLDIEVASLRAGWEKYREQQAQLVGFAENATSDPRMELRSTLLIDLPRAVGSDLREACENLLEPVKDFYNFSVRVAQIPALLQVDTQRLHQEPGKYLMATRERAQTLAILLDGKSGSGRLRFSIKKWVREQFLSFADLFLQTYQQAKFDGTNAPLDEARALVYKILAVAGLEPVEIVLGQTPFDSSKHVGRSTTSRSSMRDGSIAGVVKNGFQQVGGPVVQQPEVIVNRL